jgi:RimJ/RimL family protein N-acetyltransferase
LCRQQADISRLFTLSSAHYPGKLTGPQMTKLTANVRIRPYLVTDADALYASVHESIADMHRWMPWCHANYTTDDARGWVEAQVTAREMGSVYDFAIVGPDGIFAGACGINRIDGLNRVANLGYWVRSSRAGRGYAPVAVAQVVSWVFANTNLNRLEVVVAADNIKSQRVAEKIGAKREALMQKRVMLEGRSEDAFLYALLRGA